MHIGQDEVLEPASRRVVQWYPGHIAKAERQLREQLGQVDLVLEVIDARLVHWSEVLEEEIL